MVLLHDGVCRREASEAWKRLKVEGGGKTIAGAKVNSFETGHK